MMSTTLLLQYRLVHKDQLPSCISLAASLHKLVLTLLQPLADEHQQPQQSKETREHAAEAFQVVANRVPTLITSRQQQIKAINMNAENPPPAQAQESPKSAGDLNIRTPLVRSHATK